PPRSATPAAKPTWTKPPPAPSSATPTKPPPPASNWKSNITKPRDLAGPGSSHIPNQQSDIKHRHARADVRPLPGSLSRSRTHKRKPPAPARGLSLITTGGRCASRRRAGCEYHVSGGQRTQ